MTWNYRLVRRVTKAETYYAIHEAYYNKDGVCDAITQDGVDIGGDSIAECKRVYKMMREAFNTPVLDYETRKNI